MLRTGHPGIDVTLRDRSTAEQTAALRADEIEVGFLRRLIPRDFVFSVFSVVHNSPLN